MNIISIEQEAVDCFNNMEMTISWGGYAELDENWHRSDMCSAFSRIYFIKDGGGIVECNGEETILKPGYMYIIPIGVTFSYRCPDRMTQIFFHVNMSKGAGGDFLYNYKNVKEIYVGEKLVDEAERAASAETYFDIMSAKKLLYKCVGMCLENDGTDSLTPYKSPFVSDVIKYININLSINLKAEEIAEHFFCFAKYTLPPI